jgi:hypothetical protein
MLESKFYLFPAISLLFRAAGRAAGRVLDIAKIQLTQPSLVELGLGLSLAKIWKHNILWLVANNKSAARSYCDNQKLYNSPNSI